jgi:centrosomal protein CEP76
MNSIPTAWVTTISPEGDAEFWDPISGGRWKSFEMEGHGFRTIGCLFNAEGFWANASVNDGVRNLRFDLGDSNIWKAIPKDAVLSLRKLVYY